MAKTIRYQDPTAQLALILLLLVALSIISGTVVAATKAQLEAEVAELSRKLEEQKRQMERTKRELDDARRALATTHAATGKAEGDADAARRQVLEAKKQVEALQTETATARQQAALASQEAAEARREAELAKEEAETARAEAAIAERTAAELRADLYRRPPPERPKIKLGPVTVGGAMRVNYVLGSYEQNDPGNGPNRGGNSGNVELDTFRINLTLDYQDIIGALEYRWYSDAGQNFAASYSFLHTGWVGYRFAEQSHIEIGVNRVPFGPGIFGISQSYMFDMHYYLGLADDMDLGIKYVTRTRDWKLDLAYYLRSEGSYAGRSLDSTRYSFDAVRWTHSVDELGNVDTGAPRNGFEERNQFNARAIRVFDEIAVPTELGVSLQYGQLKGHRVDDGDHWAASLHMINEWDDWRLASQVTRYQNNIDRDNPWGTDKLLPMGAFDFPWFAAAKAWIPAVSLSYTENTPRVRWLDKVVPYVEYSHVVKDERDFNDSQMLAAGVQWFSGAWLVYTDLVFANGNLFIGNESDDGADNYGRVDGVGDWGANGNDRWNYRFTITLGYYF